jgi:hypothetical protein
MGISIKGDGFSLPGQGGGPPQLTISLTPETTTQAAPGALLLTATVSGGTAPTALGWTATFADGTSAAALLSGSGATRTLTTTTYGQVVIVTASVTDAGVPTQSATDSALVAVNNTSNLILSINPTTTQLGSPAGQLFSATPTGGLGPYTYAWLAIYSNGTNANALLSSLTGASSTLTPTNYRQVFRIACTVTDSSPSPQIATFFSTLSVGQPPALVPPADPTPTQLAGGTTTSPFVFGNATGGASPYSYALSVASSSGAVTLSTAVGQSGNLLNLTDLTTGRVTLLVTDSLGQTANATYTFGVAVAPIYNETGTWSVIEGKDFRTLGSGSLSGNGTLTVGGTTFTIVTATGAPASKSTTVSASGVTIVQTGVSGDQTTVSVPTTALPNFAACENILIDFLLSTTASYLACNVSVGDTTNFSTGDCYGVTVNYGAVTAAVNARRVSGGVATSVLMGTIATASKNFAVQVCLFAGRIPLMTIKESTSFITGPKLGQTQPMQGTTTGGPGSQTLATGTTIPTPLSVANIQMSVNGGTTFTVVAYQFSRFTRPPFT